MQWLRRLSVLAAVVATVVFGAGAQAHAAPPKNVGWLYTASASGAVFFDADLAGYASFEKITVCDNKTDGRGIRAVLVGTHPDGGLRLVTVEDPANDGQCGAAQDNYFADGYVVDISVCEYWGTHTAACIDSWGVA